MLLVIVVDEPVLVASVKDDTACIGAMADTICCWDVMRDWGRGGGKPKATGVKDEKKLTLAANSKYRKEDFIVQV